MIRKYVLPIVIAAIVFGVTAHLTGQQSGGPGGSIVATTCTNKAVTAIAANGAATCTTLTSSYFDTSVAQTGVDINTSYQVTATHLASALLVSQGGTGTTTAFTSGQVVFAGASGVYTSSGNMTWSSPTLTLGVVGTTSGQLTLANSSATSAVQLVTGGDGVLTLENNAGTSFARVQLGGTSASFPAIKRNSAALNFRLADDSADAAITSAAITASGTILTGSTNNIGFSTRSLLASNADGQLTLTNNAATQTNFGVTSADFRIPRGSSFDWSNAANDATQPVDTSLNRISAGVVGIGSGISGTNNGSLQVAAITASGNVLINDTSKFLGYSTTAIFRSGTDGLMDLWDQGVDRGLEFSPGTGSPTLTSCGTGTISTGSRNGAGEFTNGNAVTACTVNFGTGNFSNTPFCTIDDETTAGVGRISAISSSSFTVSGIVASDKVMWICIGRVGS